MSPPDLPSPMAEAVALVLDVFPGSTVMETSRVRIPLAKVVLAIAAVEDQAARDRLARLAKKSRFFLSMGQLVIEVPAEDGPVTTIKADPESATAQAFLRVVEQAREKKEESRPAR
jgi:hypothetical protein